jgi:hypothetical protein
MLTAQGRDDASVHANVAPASLGMCAPAVLKMTVPLSSADWTSSSVIRASSKDDPRGVDTDVTYIMVGSCTIAIT